MDKRSDQTPYQKKKRYMDSQYASEKMLNIIYHKGTAN